MWFFEDPLNLNQAIGLMGSTLDYALEILIKKLSALGSGMGKGGWRKTAIANFGLALCSIFHSLGYLI